jgi:hypothetical protein
MIPFFPAVQDVVQMLGVAGVKLKAEFVPVSRIFRARFCGEITVFPVAIASSPCTNNKGSDKVTLVIVEGTSSFPIMLRPLTSDTKE